MTPSGPGGLSAPSSEWRNFTTMSTSEIATVLAWHDAFNDHDFDTLVALSSDDIEVGDRKGAAQGHAALLEWARSAGIKAEPGRIYVHDGVVVVEQQVTSPAGDTTAAAAFRVVRDHVTSVFRHSDLAAALAATELTEQDLAG
jgi:ketosteroid isomerase-like protein